MDRVPPHNLDAERSVLSAALLENSVIGELMESLRQDDFYLNAHGEMWGAMRSLYASGQPVDLITLADHLKSIGKLEVAGGPAGVSFLGGMVSTTANVDYWANIVRDKARLRKLINKGTKMVLRAYEEPEDVARFLDTCNAQMMELSGGGCGNNFHDVTELLDAMESEIQDVMSGKKKRPGLMTGFKELDALTWGHRPGDIVAIAADSNWGKTALAVQIATYNSVDLGKSGLIFSVDQLASELVERMVSMRGGVALSKFRQFNMMGQDNFRTQTGMASIRGSRLFLDGGSRQTPATIRTRARWVQSKHGLDFIVIDYFQLLKSDRFVSNREQVLASISEELKATAKDIEVPIFVLAQVNKDKLKRAKGDQRPQPSDIRETDALRQHANAMIMIHRPWELDEGKPKDIIELHLVKQKQGPTGVVRLYWDAEHTRFHSVVERKQGEMF